MVGSGAATGPSPGTGVFTFTAKDIVKPQLKFSEKIDNSKSPWKPQIKHKPNSIKPLLISFDEDGQFFNHPYEFELDHFAPPEEQLKASDPIEPKTMDEVPLIMVDKQEQIAPLLSDLLKCRSIAIDLEHHSLRSYQGITCLMQISTGNKDYLIDTLSLRSDLHVLNEAFTNPKILKVLHAADHDILWLQRDLSLYIVNMFDTMRGAEALQLPGRSLKSLLKLYCNVNTNKKFQLADWRIRPLPKNLELYARSDTHYLIYIYEKMRNALLEADNGQTNVLKRVYQRSTEICKCRYNKPILTDNSYMKLYRSKTCKTMRREDFNSRQKYGLQHLFLLRDRIARQEDESPGYVLSNQKLLMLSSWLPEKSEDIVKLCKPRREMLAQLEKIKSIISCARKQPLVWVPHYKKDVNKERKQIETPRISGTPEFKNRDHHREYGQGGWNSTNSGITNYTGHGHGHRHHSHGHSRHSHGHSHHSHGHGDQSYNYGGIKNHSYYASNHRGRNSDNRNQKGFYQRH